MYVYYKGLNYKKNKKQNDIPLSDEVDVLKCYACV